MIQLSSDSFNKEVVQSKDVVLVDFWAGWCGPCKIMEPVIEALSEEMNGRPVKIAKLNIDEDQKTASEFGIMSIPTFLIFKNGQVVEQVVGATTKEALKGKIEKHI